MTRAWLIMVIVAALLLTACRDGSTPRDVSPAGVGDLEAGQQVFNTGGASQIPCAACHTLDGTDLVGPSLQGIGERAATRGAGMSATDYLHESIVKPSAYVVEGYDDMMNKDYADRLSDQEINDLVAFLLTR